MTPDWQTADLWPPASSMAALPAQSPAAFTVSWSGADTGPAGIASFDVQVRDGAAAAWSDWQTATAATSAAYQGVGGHAYYFRARARDQAGFVEAWPADYDAMTTVEALPPVTSVNALPAYLRNGSAISWQGNDPGGSGIRGYDVQARDLTAGDWTDWLVGVGDTAAHFIGASGHAYAFRSRAMDNARNIEPWPAGLGDANTVLYTWLIAGVVQTSAGQPAPDAVITTQPAAFRNQPSMADGAYAAYVADAASAYTVTWAKPGYGNLPPTSFAAAADAQVTVVLPPLDDVVRDGHFESGHLPAGGWSVSGSPAPAAMDFARHTGNYGAVLGQSGYQGYLTPVDFDLIQKVTIPASLSAPILSFVYQLDRGPAPAQGAFDVRLSNGSGTTTLMTTSGATDWAHRWFDLTPWLGQSVTLTFHLRQEATAYAVRVRLDEVTIGSSAYPDLWAAGAAQIAQPGAVVTFTLPYGNRGAAPGRGAVLTATLPVSLTFVSADPPPVTTGSVMTWTLGNLPANASPAAITLVATVSPDAATGVLTGGLEIAAVTNELETANNSGPLVVYVNGTRRYLPLAFARRQ